ncbi:MAG: SDR family NAD(P)-dependent oxidoreductase, partial [Pseudomonadota bacterium]
MKQVAVLTGGSRGIGSAIVARLLESGYDCLVIGLSDPGVAGADFVRTDLSDPDDTARTAAYLRELGSGNRPVSLLVNNAGGGMPSRLADADSAHITHDLVLNLTAPILLTSAVLPGMCEAGAGAIINVASTAGRTGVAFLHTYSAAKAGLIAFTQSLAAECAPYGIRAYCVCPGAVATNSARAGRAELSRLHGMEPDTYEDVMAQRTGLGRLVQPDEVAEIVQWLAIHGGPAISGQTLNICGTLT